MGIDREKDFDPSMAANISKKTEKEKIDNKEFKNIVYDPIREKSDVLEDLPFGGNQGNLIVDKGGEKSEKIAKGQILPVINMVEAAKGDKTCGEGIEDNPEE